LKRYLKLITELNKTTATSNVAVTQHNAGGGMRKQERHDVEG